MMMEFQKPYAGTLQYIPRLNLPVEILRRLRQKLLESELVQATENAEIVIDWYRVERDANRVPQRQSYIVLVRDGGDSESPGCIFYRKEIDRINAVTIETYHVPPKERQAGLAEAWKWWEDSTGQKLERLNQYLDQIAGEANAWRPL